MLRHVAEFPKSKKTLRWIRQFGSRKRLLVALAWRPNRVSAYHARWTYIAQLQLRHLGHFDPLAAFMFQYSHRYKFTYATLRLLILMGLDTTNLNGGMSFQKLCHVRQYDLKFHRLMITHKLYVAGLNLAIDGRSPVAAEMRHRFQLIKLYLDAGRDPNFIVRGTLTPLHHISRLNEPEIVKLLLDAGANVNARDGIGRTPLRIAYEFHCETVIELLKAAGGVL